MWCESLIVHNAPYWGQEDWYTIARRRRHTPEQIIHKLREAEGLQAQSATIAEVAKQLEISEQILHR